MFGRSVVLAAGCMALVFGCAEPPDETQEIVANLVKAGFPKDDIQVVDGKVYAGWDAEVTIAASREMLERGTDTDEQYRTTNLVSASVTKICINGSTFTGAFSTALDLAIQNYDEQPLSFAMARTPSAGCSFTINAVIDPNMNGGVAGFPSGGLPFGQITIGGQLSQYSVDVIEHVITHEIGHTIGLRHSDYYNRAISCGSGGNEGDAGVGAIHIPGTPTTATVGGSFMNSCFRSNETGEFTSSDITALTALYMGTVNPTCRPSQLSWSAQSLPHQIGRADADGWSASTTQDAAGFLQYGPYTTQVAAGAHTAVWNLMIDNNTADNSYVVRLEAYDATTNTLLAYREVARREWNAPFQYQPFTLPFTLASNRVGHVLEFRVFWYRTAYVREQNLMLDPSCQPVSQRWSAQSLPHQIGRADADGWSASTTQDAAGFLQYGPYTQVAAGAHTAIWNLMIDNNTADNLAVVRLEAFNATTNTLIASREITRSEWTSTSQYQAFALPFAVNSLQAGHQFEFRVYWYRTGYVRQQSLNLD